MPNLHSTKILGDLQVTGLTNLSQLGAVTLTGQLTSTVATGTAPLVIASTTAVANLNADLLDGNHASAFYLASNPSNYASGTVTSIATSGSVSGLTLTGGTITTSGTITLGGTLSVAGSNFGSQTANTFLAAPNGSAGNPTFRTIVAADIPTLNQNTTGSAGSVVQSVTFNNSGSGAASGTTYNGSTARTISYNTIGAEPTLTKGNLTATGPISLSATRQVIGGAATITHDNSGVTAGSYNNVTVNATGHVTAGSTVAYLTTQNTSKNIVGGSNTANADAVATNGNVHLNHLENSTVTSTHRISGSGATTVTSDASGNITISSTDNNTTYSEISEAETDSGTDSNLRTITGRRYQYGIRNNVTATTTANLAVGATVSGATKTVNLGTGAASGSTTNVNIGSANGGTTIIASPNTTISGNLTINGTTTTINSTVKVLNDPIMSLGGTGAAPTVNDAKDRGIQFVHYDSAARNGFFGYDNSLVRFIYVPQATLTDEVVSGNTGIARFSNLELGNLTGNIGTISTATLTENRTYTLPNASGTVSLDGHTHTITANATDGLFDITGTNGSNAVTYALAPYTTQQALLSFDTSTTAPTRTDRLNLNGSIHTTNVNIYGNNSLLFATHGGGFNMVDSTWIRTTGNKSFYHNTGEMRTDGTLQVGGSGSTLNVVNNGNFAYRTNTLFANTSGNVGIGTAAPDHKLHVTGTSSLFNRDLYVFGNTSGNFGNRLIVGNNTISNSLQDSNLRPTIQAHGAYPVLSLNHTVTTNVNHGPTVQFTANGTGNQFVIGMTGNGGRLDIGTSSNTNWNPHNGINNYEGTTIMSFSTGGSVGIGTLTPAEKLHVVGDVQIDGAGGTIGGTTLANGWLKIGTTLAMDDNEIYFGTTGFIGTIGAFALNLNTNGQSRWNVGTTGIFESTGAQTIRTSTGNLTLATAAGNGNIILTPNGTGAVTSAARLGLGTTAPGSVIHVKNATPEIKLEAGSSTDSGTMRYNTTTKSIEFIFA